MDNKKINLYGLGPANLILAYELGKSKDFEVHIFEKNKAGGRKYLVAGKGGFNISNNLPAREMAQYFQPVQFLNKAIELFDVNKLRNWYAEIGINTYIGSSNKVFPEKNIKPIEVYNAIMEGLQRPNIHIHYSSTFFGFTEEGVIINDSDKKNIHKADYHVFSLGGASWSITGSDGHWVKAFQNENIHIKPFQPANCGIIPDLKKDFLEKNQGSVIKNVEILYKSLSIKGEFIITDYGFEGYAIYPISNEIYNVLAVNDSVEIYIDFKIQWNYEKLFRKLSSIKGSTNDRLKKIKLANSVIQLLKNQTTKEQWIDMRKLSKLIKSFPISINAVKSIEESISTGGGVSIESLSPDFELINKRGYYCIGEMVEWTAPTGGFLLHGCFAMGYFISKKLKAS